MIQSAVLTSPKQAFLIAATATVGAVTVLQAPQVAPHLTSVASTAFELTSAALPADLGAAAAEVAALGQPQLPDAIDVASLDPATFVPSASDDGGAGLSPVLADLLQQVADPAAWVVPAAQGGIIGDLFNIVEDVVQFVWNVITLPFRIVEDVISDVLGLF